MLNNRFANWVTNTLKSRNSKLLNKIGRSLERDKDHKFPWLARKTAIYLRAMVTAPFHLRKCDTVGKKPRTRKKPYIENTGKIKIGNYVNINSKNVQTDFITGPNGFIEIGDEVSMNFGVSIVSENKVTIGNRVRIGPYTMIFDTDRHLPGQPYEWAGGQPVIIEDDVWLATRVLVQKGALIGRGSIIASGSVVSGFIPPYVVAAGMPARIIKFLKVTDENSSFHWSLKQDGKKLTRDTIDRVEKIVRELFTHPQEELTELKNTPGSITGWDSIKHVKMIRRLEEEFGITFRQEDWPRLSNFNKICTIIQQYQQDVTQFYNGNQEHAEMPKINLR